MTERDTSESPAFLEVRGLRKRFGEREVLQDFSLDVASGEILALLGVSGSGKTTALRLLAGLDAPDGGRVLLGGDDVTELPAARRGVGMVFQHYALFPHLTIGENVSFGLEGRGLGRDEVRRRAEEALVQVRLPGHFDGKVGALSGGMQQRVAIARALAPAPRVLLLDEPFSNLDPQLREYTRRELRDTIRRIGITTVLVTHEQEEAFDVADRVALLVGGRLEQVGTPEDLYERPRTLAVGAFIGRSALLAGPFVESADSGDAGVRIRPDLVWSGVRAEAIGVGEPAAILLRPESLRFVEPGDASALPGVVESRRFAGPRSYFRVALEGGIAGETVEVLARTGAVAIGERVAVAPDPKGSPPQIFVAPAKRVGS